METDNDLHNQGKQFFVFSCFCMFFPLKYNVVNFIGNRMIETVSDCTQRWIVYSTRTCKNINIIDRLFDPLVILTRCNLNKTNNKND